MTGNQRLFASGFVSLVCALSFRLQGQVTSERLAADVPGARLIETWKDGEAVHSARAEVDAFLDANA